MSSDNSQFLNKALLFIYCSDSLILRSCHALILCLIILCLCQHTGSELKGGEVCAGCESPIADRFLLRVNERSWHETCVKCAVCLCALSGTCYSRDRLLYCKHDYEK